jgi:cysteine desulfurase/selenocysteine lyase
MDFYQIPGTVRASFAFYNTHEEVERFITGVEKAVSMLR